MIRALISRARGIAVYDDGEKVGIVDGRELIDLENLKKAPQDRPGNSGEAMQALAGAVDIEALDVADLAALETHVLMRIAQQESLTATLLLIDSTQPAKVRKLAAESLWRAQSLLEHAWVEGVLLSTPLPLSAGIDDLGAFEPPNLEFLRSLHTCQKQVTILSNCWYALPSQVFRDEDRQYALKRAIRAGVFRTFLMGGFSDATTGPFKPALGALRVTLDQIVQHSKIESPIPYHQLILSNNFDEQAPKWLWDIAPWRTAWTATHWPEIELQWACRAAPSIITHRIKSTLAGNQSKEVEKSIFIKVFRRWKEIFHKSTDASWVRLISALDQTHINEEMASKLIANLPAAMSKTSASNNLFGYIQPRPDPTEADSTTASFFQNLFGLSEILPSRALYDTFRKFSPRRRNQLNYAETVDEAQRRAGVRMIFQVKKIRKALAAPNFSMDEHNDSVDIGRYTRIIGRYGMYRRLNRKGCLVVIVASHHAATKTPDIAWLLNPEHELNVQFKGSNAAWLESLAARLWADLSSGLRSDRCGWQSMRVSSFQTLVRAADVDDIKHKIKEGGLNDAVIEIRNGEVRLNPDFVVILPRG